MEDINTPEGEKTLLIKPSFKIALMIRSFMPENNVIIKEAITKLAVAIVNLLCYGFIDTRLRDVGFFLCSEYFFGLISVSQKDWVKKEAPHWMLHHNYNADISL